MGARGWGERRAAVEPLRRLPWWGGWAAWWSDLRDVRVPLTRRSARADDRLTVAGQQVASVFVDRYGLLRRPAGRCRRRGWRGGGAAGGGVLITLA